MVFSSLSVSLSVLIVLRRLLRWVMRLYLLYSFYLQLPKDYLFLSLQIVSLLSLPKGRIQSVPPHSVYGQGTRVDDHKDRYYFDRTPKVANQRIPSPSGETHCPVSQVHQEIP